MADPSVDKKKLNLFSPASRVGYVVELGSDFGAASKIMHVKKSNSTF